jgi:cytochrome c
MTKGFSGIIAVVVVAVMLAGFGGPASADGDAGHGKQVFKKCAVCHSLEPGKVKIGPPLHGLLGRKAGTVKRFNYSGAMKSANVVWSLETLDKYLAAPKKFIPGNRMPFPGLPNAKDRADLIAYLNQAARGN